jgi:hypothetical protein
VNNNTTLTTPNKVFFSPIDIGINW